MNIGLLFYSDTLSSLHDIKTQQGRSVANHDFLKALFQYSSEDQISLFVSSIAEKEYLCENLTFIDESSVIPFAELATHFQYHNVNLLHCLGPDLYRALSIRAQFGLQAAVSGMTHSLAHQPYLEWLHLNLLLDPQSSDTLVCTSPAALQVVKNFQKKVLANLGKDSGLNLAHIPLGIDLNHYSTTQRIRHHEKPYLIFLGRLSYFTKVDLLPLLYAYYEVADLIQEDLLIAGAEGQENYAQILESAIHELGLRNRVHLHLNVNEEEKKSLIQNATAFLAPSDSVQESFGLTLLESQALGTPVIASDWNGYRQLLTDGQEGFLIPTLGPQTIPSLDAQSQFQIDSMNHLIHSQNISFNFKVWQESVLKLCQNPVLRESMSRACLANVQAYSWDKIIAQYYELWRKMSKSNFQGQAQKKFQGINYVQDFFHYPSEIFDDSTEWTLSLLGEKLLLGHLPLRLYSSLESMLDSQVLEEILVASKETQNLFTLKRSLKIKAKDDSIRYCILWLFKYGFLEKKDSRKSLKAP